MLQQEAELRVNSFKKNCPKNPQLWEVQRALVRTAKEVVSMNITKSCVSMNDCRVVSVAISGTEIELQNAVLGALAKAALTAGVSGEVVRLTA